MSAMGAWIGDNYKNEVRKKKKTNNLLSRLQRLGYRTNYLLEL